MRKTNIKTCISTLFVILITILVINTITNQSYSPKNEIQEELTTKKIELPSPSLTLAWTPNGTAICTANDSQILPKICYDGAGGTIITWEDWRNGTHSDIYAQRIDSNGTVKWATNGVIICNASYDQWFPWICSDGMGGAIIIWEDWRSGTNWDIYAQRIDANGNTMWMPNGLAICTSKYDQSDTRICSDGAGGAIVTWVDQITGSEYDIYAQRIDSNGNVLWMNNGTDICTERYDQIHPHICNDGMGGAIITWADNRSGIYWTIYAQRINSGGNIQWTPNGTAICNARYGQYLPQICSDGMGGAIITWYDWGSGTDWDIYAQKINTNGITQWMDNGTAICTANDLQYWSQICSDGFGGAIITWVDQRTGSEYDIYAQRIDSNGNIKWTTNGEVICNANDQQYYPQICSNEMGGAIITWYDRRSGANFDIYAQRIDSKGNVKWTTIGEVICNATDNQYSPQICSDGMGGAIITWNDWRSGTNFDIYVQRIKSISTPTIETLDVIYVMKSDTMLSGEIYDDGGTDIIEMRFEWGKTYSCSDGWTNNISSLILDNFYFHLKDLLPNTTYYFRALARNSEGWSNGSVKSFTTLDSDTYEWYHTSGGDIGYFANKIAFDSSDNMYIAGAKKDYGPVQGNEIFLAKFDNLGNEQWIYSWEGKNFNQYRCEAIVVDSFNNIYIAGTVGDSINMDYNIFLVKFDNSGNEKWNLTCGGGDSEFFSGLAVDSNNNVYVAGTTSSFGAGEEDFYLVKYNSSGVQQWFGTWGGSNADYCCDLVVDSFDNIILGGYTYSFGAGGTDIWLIKLDNSGVEKWNHTWGGTGWDYCYYLAVDSNNNVYISGQTSGNKMCLIKFDNLGVEKWNRIWDTSEYYNCDGLAADSNNNVYVTINFYSSATGEKNNFLVKYNDLGIQQWNRTWGGGSTDYWCGFALNSSNVIHLLMYSSYGVFSGDLFIVTYDSLGIQQSYYTWQGTNDASGLSIAIDSLDNVYSAGYTDTYGNGGFDIYLIKYDNMGTEKWKLTWGKKGNEICFDIALDGLNNIFLAGYADNFETGRGDMCLVKLDDSGKEQWNVTWGTSEMDVCSAINLDSSGNIYLAGITKIAGENQYKLCLVKFNSLGIYQWNRTFGKIGERSLWTLSPSCGVAVDSLDNIYLSGSSISFGTTNYDYCLVKYDSSGIQQWSKTWDLSEEDFFSAIELDSSDNVYLTGSVYDSIIDKQDACLIKYDSLGVQQWNRTWGGDDWYDSYVCRDLTIDSNNNIYVAGSGFQQVTNDYSMFIVKYDNSGNEHWNLTWEGYDFDACTAIALDSLNNIYLGGQTFDLSSGVYGWEVFVVKIGQSSLPDTLSPNTEIISGPSGIISYNDVIFTWTGSDDITSTLDLVYSYYLEGYDSDWSIWTSNTNKTYDNLPNGDYLFMVRAKDSAGNIEQIPSNQSFTVFATLPPEWGIDKDLVDLINLYAPLYYNDFWNISLSQYKSWIALITLREAGLGRYAAHSQYGCGYEGDKFNHVNAGEDFPFSTGIGAFQLDRGGSQGNANENWGILSTIEKLDPELSLISALRWHQDRFIWVDVNLADFSEYSAWYAVQPANEDNFAITWKNIAGYEWEECKANKMNVSFNPPIVFDVIENNVEYLGQVRWYLDNFNGYFDTWLINSRDWLGNIVTQYYYTYREDMGCEIWVYNDPGKTFVYEFERNYTEGQFPEDRVDVGCPSIAGSTGVSSALNPIDIPLIKVNAFEISRNWARNPDTSLPCCIIQLKYNISNLGTVRINNVIVNVATNGEIIHEGIITELNVEEDYIVQFSLSIDYDTFKTLVVNASYMGFTEDYEFVIGANLPRAPHGSEMRLFITPDDPIVKSTLNDILNSYPTIMPEWMAIRDWVGQMVTYAYDNDEHGVDEYFQLPRETILKGEGDCEDFSLLLVSLLRANGWDSLEVYVTLGANEAKDAYHAWIRLNLGFPLGWYNIEPQADVLSTLIGDYFALSGFEAISIFNDLQYETLQITASLHSPGELRVYDSFNRTTGLINGTVKCEIPNSLYDHNNSIITLFSSDINYRFQVIGTGNGEYGLEIISLEFGNPVTFNAIDIPISAKQLNQFSVDWSILSTGGEGVRIQIDIDGDGEFDYDFYSDSELSQEEYLDVIQDEIGTPFIPGYNLFILIGAVCLVILITKKQFKNHS